MPKLIYIKRSEHRQERLDELLARIRDDDGASYVAFTDAAELADLVTADLATLLAERFDAAERRHEPPRRGRVGLRSSTESSAAGAAHSARGPRSRTRTIARMLTRKGAAARHDHGPGWHRQEPLAVAAAREVEAAFPDGVVFVDLAPVLDAGLVTAAVANALGVRDTGDRRLAEKVARALAGRRVLLVLDNVEQVVDAAPELSALLAGSSATVLATSRILLRVRGEQNVPLGPARRRMRPPSSSSNARARSSPTSSSRRECRSGCRDLRERSTTSRSPSSSPPLVCVCCRRRHWRNGSITRCRCSSAARAIFPTVSARSRDHRMERPAALGSRAGASACAWESSVPASVSMRSSGWPMAWRVDAVEALGALVDGSLVREQGRGSQAWFTMLATVREYGRDRLAERGHLAERRSGTRGFYVGLAAAKPKRRRPGRGQVGAGPRLLDELDELRAAVDHLLGTRRFDDVASSCGRCTRSGGAGADPARCGLG